jgi:cytochrome oxidase Cu insertion factor (SCO1/SenC/PrrC family)
MRRWLGQGVAVLFGVVVAAMAAVGSLHITFDQPVFTGGQLAGDITVGTPAPDFTLTDALSGRAVSLHQLWGRPVALLFVVPAAGASTAPAAFVDALARALGSLAPHVHLVAVNADPLPLSTAAVAAWVRTHGLTRRLTMLTGGLVALDSVWTSYQVDVSVVGGRPAYSFCAYVLAPGGAEEAAFDLGLRPSAARQAQEVRAVAAALRAAARDRS